METGLSVGIEFKVVVGFKRKMPSGKRLALNSVVEAIQSTERKVRLYLPKSLRTTLDFTVWNVAPYVTISDVTSGSNTSLRAPTSHNKVLVITPTFFPTRNDWEIEVRTVLDRLKGHFMEKGFLWMANSLNGLRVVVGSVEGENTCISFTLEQVRRIAKFVVKYEGIVDELHEEYGSLNKPNAKSNRHNPLLDPLSLSQVFEMLDRCRTIEEIIGAVNYTGEDVAPYGDDADSDFFKVNFTSLLTYGNIEFLQHAGTVDAWATIRWVNIVLSVVSFAKGATDELIAELGESRQAFDEITTGAM